MPGARSQETRDFNTEVTEDTEGTEEGGFGTSMAIVVHPAES